MARLARLAALGQHAARRHGVPSALRASLAAAVRVVDGVHGRAAHVRAPAAVPVATGLAHADVLVVGVAEAPDRGAALDVDLAQLAGGELHDAVVALARLELRVRAGGAADLTAAAGTHLHVVDHQAGRDLAELERVARQRVGAGAGEHRLADDEL